MLKKISFEKILVVYIIIQAIIDISTGISVRSSDPGLTTGILVRTIFLAGISIYTLIISKKETRNKILIYYLIAVAYFIVSLIVTYIQSGAGALMMHIKGIAKTFYFPVMLISLFAIFKEKNIKLDSKVFVYSLLGYTLTIALAQLLGIAQPSYKSGSGEGTSGLFYAANEIGIIMAILSSYLAIYIIKSKKVILSLISIVLFTYSALELGTKVALMGLILILFAIILVSIIKLITEKKLQYLIKAISSLVLIGVVVLSLGYTSVGKNVEKSYGISFFKITLGEEKIEKNENEKIEKEIGATEILSNRNNFLDKNLEKYKDSNIENKFLGLGYVENNNENIEISKTAEMDMFDIILTNGVIGAMIYFMPILILAVIILKDLVMNFKKAIINEDILLLGYGILIAIAISTFAGHALTAPAVSFLIAITTVQLYQKLKEI